MASADYSNGLTGGCSSLSENSLNALDAVRVCEYAMPVVICDGIERPIVQVIQFWTKLLMG
jgi:hypothetical protein